MAKPLISWTTHKYHLLWVVWAIALAALMLSPSDSFPESKLLSYDKLGHIGVYMIFTYLLSLAFQKQTHSEKLKIISLKLALTISIVYGAILELFQQMVPGRMTDLYDLIANAIGAVIGTIVFVTFTKISLRFLN